MDKNREIVMEIVKRWQLRECGYASFDDEWLYTDDGRYVLMDFLIKSEDNTACLDRWLKNYYPELYL